MVINSDGGNEGRRGDVARSSGRAAREDVSSGGGYNGVLSSGGGRREDIVGSASCGDGHYDARSSGGDRGEDTSASNSSGDGYDGARQSGGGGGHDRDWSRQSNTASPPGSCCGKRVPCAGCDGYRKPSPGAHTIVSHGEQGKASREHSGGCGGGSVARSKAVEVPGLHSRFSSHRTGSRYQREDDYNGR